MCERARESERKSQRRRIRKKSRTAAAQQKIKKPSGGFLWVPKSANEG